MCICGAHHCLHKRTQDFIKPHVYRSGLPKTEAQEKYIWYHNQPLQKALKPFSLNWMNEVLEPKFPMKNIPKINQVLLHGDSFSKDERHRNAFDHSPYIPKASCHSVTQDEPAEAMAVGACRDWEANCSVGKECGKCLNVFSSLNRSLEKNIETDGFAKTCNDICTACTEKYGADYSRNLLKQIQCDPENPCKGEYAIIMKPGEGNSPEIQCVCRTQSNYH
ncbi:uncharacterized protein LOC118185220 [Stegodyphus dumicola]|uniref:uncharacterized protein LOC118185220 n=1 Tax=Stegodyphus dumicola TaxID=202533 RepID=UPI0015AF6241|nr:uncharacterized protein LOC118185220 [Stegodyphus dumicola]